MFARLCPFGLTRLTSDPRHFHVLSPPQSPPSPPLALSPLPCPPPSAPCSLYTLSLHLDPPHSSCQPSYSSPSLHPLHLPSSFMTLSLDLPSAFEILYVNPNRIYPDPEACLPPDAFPLPPFFLSPFLYFLPHTSSSTFLVYLSSRHARF